jgi:3'(2'), 5'-bisphosphate nucleotidase
MNPLKSLSDVELARTLALQAGNFLSALRAKNELTGRELGDAADRGANEVLLAALAAARPNDAVLSEESSDDLRRLTAERVWIIDPLDGTREYREARDDWAVHVALVCEGEVRAAAVALPARKEIFASDDAAMSISDSSSQSSASARKVVISRSRPPAFAERVANALDAELVQVGSAGAKAMMVVRGDAIAYVHDGGMNEWDAAAPVGVALAHGLHVSDLRGEPIAFNRRDVILREGLIICAKNVAGTILAAL